MEEVNVVNSFSNQLFLQFIEQVNPKWHSTVAKKIVLIETQSEMLQLEG